MVVDLSAALDRIFRYAAGVLRILARHRPGAVKNDGAAVADEHIGHMVRHFARQMVRIR